MPTSFEVIQLGRLAYTDGRTYFMDETEGNADSELANLLEGFTFGSATTPISDGISSFDPSASGFAGGAATAYDTNNTAVNGGETFLIDGVERTFDAIAVFNATITYASGGSAGITAVIFQDTDGVLYLAPEISDNADNVALQAGQIATLRLDTVNNANALNFAANRFQTDFVCFTAGTPVDTPNGPVLVEQLRAGDLVCTADNGVQRIVWAGTRKLGRGGKLAASNKPVIIRAGYYGATQDIRVSQQHAIAVADGRLVRAKHLAEMDSVGARIALGCRSVQYVHLLLEQHQVLMTAGLRSESLYPGPMGLSMLDDAGRAGLAAVVPDARWIRLGLKSAARVYGETARPILRRREARALFDTPLVA